VRSRRVIVIGAGVAGLAAAIELAARGIEVLVLERAQTPGGKMREVQVGDVRLDAGPTVLTMRWVFDELFEHAGASFEAAVPLRAAEVIARHAWSEREQLDLFGDVARSADAIGALAGRAEAEGYRRFCADARAIYETLERPFLRAPRPSVTGLVRSIGVQRLGELWRIRPFATLWRALHDYFRDPRLRQLFGRYATYVGSSPFQAPATLMLVAHVEREGVWLVEGGMHRIAVASAALAARHGAILRFGAEVVEITAARGRATGAVLANGERLEADAVLCNADVAALAAGRFGATGARGAPARGSAPRSLSAVTWSLVAKTAGFRLVHHTVFFSSDYRAEFDDLFRLARLPREPTVYVCAQDRDARDGASPPGPERLLCLVNAPASGDARSFEAAEIEPCERRAFERLARCGLDLQRRAEATVMTTPADFERLFPATGGALYGAACHGWRAPFRRGGPRTRVPGLYLAGGSTHPGAGVPMAGLSGRLAASAILADLASTRWSRAAATSGGTSTR
jgi:1-hydroxycarotenoid 3,4-desaturase